MLRILIVDNHPVCRAGYREILICEPRYEVDEARDGKEALQSLTRRSYNLVLLDLQLTDSSGLEVLAAMQILNASIPVLITSALPANQYVYHVMRAGAKGYLSKGADLREARTAVQSVLMGDYYVDSGSSRLIAFDEKAPHERLSTQEFEVFYQLARGVRLSTIASRMRLIVKTVSTYRTRLLNKMKLENNMGVAAYAHRHGLFAQTEPVNTRVTSTR